MVGRFYIKSPFVRFIDAELSSYQKRIYHFGFFTEGHLFTPFPRLQHGDRQPLDAEVEFGGRLGGGDEVDGHAPQLLV